MRYQKINSQYLLVLKRGEKIIESLTKFLKEKRLCGGQIQGIGAVDEVSLAHYSVKDKKYSSVCLNEPLEMVSLLGNFFPDEDKNLIIHLHGSFSQPNGKTFSGHLVEGKVSATAELFITPIATKITKKFDSETGLKILNLRELLPHDSS